MESLCQFLVLSLVLWGCGASECVPLVNDCSALVTCTDLAHPAIILYALPGCEASAHVATIESDPPNNGRILVRIVNTTQAVNLMEWVCRRPSVVGSANQFKIFSFMIHEDAFH